MAFTPNSPYNPMPSMAFNPGGFNFSNLSQPGGDVGSRLAYGPQGLTYRGGAPGGGTYTMGQAPQAPSAPSTGSSSPANPGVWGQVQGYGYPYGLMGASDFSPPGFWSAINNTPTVTGLGSTLATGYPLEALSQTNLGNNMVLSNLARQLGILNPNVIQTLQNMSMNPQNAGFTPQMMSAMQSADISNTGQAFNTAQRGVMQQLGERGLAGGNIPSSGMTGQTLAPFEVGRAQTIANQLAQLQQASGMTGLQRQMQAQQALQGAAGMFNPASYFVQPSNFTFPGAEIMQSVLQRPSLASTILPSLIGAGSAGLLGAAGVPVAASLAM